MQTIKAMVRTKDGQITKLTSQAETLDAFREEIDRQGGEIIQINSATDDQEGAKAMAPKEQIDFFEGIATLVGAGLTIQQTFDISVMLQNSPKVATITRGIRDEINKGSDLSKALNHHIENLPPLVLGMIGIGEKTGMLGTVLNHMLGYMRVIQKMREKIVSASMYPALIIILSLAGVIGLLVFFIPQMEKSFGAGGGPMAATLTSGFGNLRLMLLGTGAVFLVPVFALIGYRWARKHNPAWAVRFERLLFRLPVAGTIARTSQLLALSFSLEVLASSSVQLDEALLFASRGTWSLAFRDMLTNASLELKRGTQLSAALSKAEILPQYFIRWIQIAEQTGKATQAFAQLRLFYEKDLDKHIARVMTLIEPVLIALIGLGLIAVIVTVVLPLFTIYSVGVQ